MRVRINTTPRAPRHERGDPVERVTVAFVGDHGETHGLMVLSRTIYQDWLRPVLLTGSAINGLHLFLEEID